MPSRESKYAIFKIRGACFLGGVSPEQVARHIEQLFAQNNYTLRGGTIEVTAVDWVTDQKAPIEVMSKLSARADMQRAPAKPKKAAVPVAGFSSQLPPPPPPPVAAAMPAPPAVS